MNSLLDKLRSLYNEMGEEMDPSLDRSEYCVSKEYIAILEEQYARCFDIRVSASVSDYRRSNEKRKYLKQRIYYANTTPS